MRTAAFVLAVFGGLLLPGAAVHASCRCRPVAEYAPVWSPDDTEIAYTEAYTNAHVFSRTTGNDSITPSPSPNLVYSPDWREAAAIVNDNARGYLLLLIRPGATVPTVDSAFPTPPAWSPDGLRLAYIGADEGLHVFDEITNATRLVEAHVYPYSSPAWSPDGSSLAFVSGKDVFVVPAAGGAARNVTHAVPGTHVDPVWSPRGDALAVNTDFGRRVVVVGLDGAPRLDTESQLPVAYTASRLRGRREATSCSTRTASIRRPTHPVCTC
jgi:Tol biopolymer transport system component